jgi:hypothetical protein
VNDDVHTIDERRDGFAIEHIASYVLCPLPAMFRTVERTAGHPHDPSDLARALEGADHGPADVPGRARDGHRQGRVFKAWIALVHSLDE